MKNSKTFRLIFLLSVCICVSLSSFTVGAYALTDNYNYNINQMASVKAGSFSQTLLFEDTLAFGTSLPINSITISVPKWYNEQGFIPSGFYSDIIEKPYLDSSGNVFASYSWRGNPCWQTMDSWSFLIYVQDYLVDGCKVKFLTIDAIFNPNNYNTYINSPYGVDFYQGDSHKGYNKMTNPSVVDSNNETTTVRFISTYMNNWVKTIDSGITKYTHFLGPISLYQGAHYDGSLSDGSSDDNIFNIDMSGASCSCGDSSNCECGYYWDKLQDIFGEDLSGLSVLNENISNMSNQIQNIQQNLNQVYNVIVGSPAPSDPDNPSQPTTNAIGNLDGFTDSDYSFEAPDLEDVKPILSDIFGSFPAPIVAGISLICVVLLALKILSR